MKIFKYIEFIKEDNFQDPPEEFIKTKLMKLKKKIDSIFADVVESGLDDDDSLIDETEEGESIQSKGVSTMSDALKRGIKKKSGEDKISFKDMNVSLESSDISKYSSRFDSLKVIFSDDLNRYDLFITIPLSDAIVDNGEDFSDKDLEECSIKFKKYSDGIDLVGQIGPRKVKIDEIDENFLVNLKIELDDEYSEGDEEFEIET
jgi:hypothetical protein